MSETLETSDEKGPDNPFGGLTLVSTPGFEDLTESLAKSVTELSRRPGRDFTPVDVVHPTLGYFTNGEVKDRHTSEHIAGHDVMIITGGPGTPEMLIRTQLLLGTVARRRPTRIILFTPHFPMGRSDVESESELCMPAILVPCWQTASTVSGTCLLDRVVCVDPHSDSILSTGGGGVVTPVRMTRKLLSNILRDALKLTNNIVISFPDSSSKKRFNKALPKIKEEFGRDFPIVFASANRDDSGKLIENVYGDVAALEGALVIEVDDEVDSGGTLIDVANLLLRHGAWKVWSGVTHGVLSGSASVRFSAPGCPIDRLHIMDTIRPHKRPELAPLLESGRLRVISWADDYAEVILRIHWRKGIRELR